jgi:aspartate/methionine/tyrosine aminotransferase
MLNPLAQELNQILDGTTALSLLSDAGTRMFFPKGIIAQSAEAKKLGKTANATIGMTVVNGSTAIIPSIQELIPTLTSEEIVSYAPTAGFPDLRKEWKEKQLLKNPLLKNKVTSLPVVVPGLTAGLSYMSDMFLDESRPLLSASPAWGNYALIVQTRRNAPLHKFKIFADGKFNLSGIEAAVKEEAASGFVRILFNFPQNPTGYTPAHEEMMKLCRILREAADTGAKILVLCDDAYFGLNYEDYIEQQSLFAYLADLHENIFAVKIDGPTKEDFAWGLRCGFITFAGKGLTDVQYEALIKKLMGFIRSSVSCSSTPSQTLLMHAFKDPAIEDQKAQFRKLLEKRYKKVKAFVNTHTSSCVEALPFNSGYFMSLHLTGINAEQLRVKLLQEKQIGTIAIDQETLRIAFSSLDEDKIEIVYSAIYETAEQLSNV